MHISVVRHTEMNIMFDNTNEHPRYPCSNVTYSSFLSFFKNTTYFYLLTSTCPTGRVTWNLTCPEETSTYQACHVAKLQNASVNLIFLGNFNLSRGKKIDPTWARVKILTADNFQKKINQMLTVQIRFASSIFSTIGFVCGQVGFRIHTSLLQVPVTP